LIDVVRVKRVVVVVSVEEVIRTKPDVKNFSIII